MLNDGLCAPLIKPEDFCDVSSIRVLVSGIHLLMVVAVKKEGGLVSAQKWAEHRGSEIIRFDNVLASVEGVGMLDVLETP